MDEEAHLFARDKKSVNFVKDYKRGRGACFCFVQVVLVIALVICLCAVIALGVLYGVSLMKKSPSSSSSLCTTPNCVSLAQAINYNLDLSVDPCEDFYNYSCRGWVDKNIIPSGSGIWGVFEELDERNQIALKKLLEGDQDSHVEAIQLTRKLYQSCMDLDQITKTGAQPLQQVLMSVGGWELIGLYNESDGKWTLNGSDFMNAKMKGDPGFFTLDVAVDDKNSSQHVVELMQSGLSLPSADAYSDDSLNEVLVTYISAVLKLLSNDTLSDSDSTTAAQQILDLEKELAKIFVSNVALRDPQASYNPVSLKNLSNGTYFKQFNWTHYIIGAFGAVNKIVTDKLTVIVRTPSYFKKLSDVYDKFNSSTLENYYKWQLASQYVRYLGRDFLGPYYDYTSAISGSGAIERYKTCISDVQNLAPFPVARLYTDYVLPAGTNTTVKGMVEEIKKAFQQRLKEKTWLDKETIQKSIWKVGNITEMIAFPQSIYNDTLLLEESAVLATTNSSYFETFLYTTVVGSIADLTQLDQPVDKTEWELPPTVVNAYYEPLYNEFVFLEGILNRPFLAQGAPEYFNYGGFGVVIGHELSHGFDDQGQQYDQHGILIPWWTKKSTDNFNERKKCYVEQYSKYSIFGHHVNGNLTLGENIADNGGIHTAYQAYKNVLKSSGKTPQSLPSINLTPDQLFFVSFAQLWCSMFTPEFIATDLQVNPHSPGPYRVIGAVSNSKDFAEAFKCSSKAPMNPSDKCDLW